jgi:hypothetical protein
MTASASSVGGGSGHTDVCGRRETEAVTQGPQVRWRRPGWRPARCRVHRLGAMGGLARGVTTRLTVLGHGGLEVVPHICRRVVGTQLMWKVFPFSSVRQFCGFGAASVIRLGGLCWVLSAYVCSRGGGILRCAKPPLGKKGC